MPSCCYRFRQGGQERALLFVRASEALYSAIGDLHVRDAEPTVSSGTASPSTTER